MTRRASEQTGHARPPTTPQSRTKGSDHDEAHQDDRPASPGDDPRGTRRERGPQTPRRKQQSIPAPRRRETYAEQRARLDAEAVDRWAVIVADWPPMTDDQIRSLAVILNRIDARLTGQRPRQQRHD